MALLTIERKTPKLGQDVWPNFSVNRPYNVEAAKKLIAGGVLALNAAGNIVPATSAGSLYAVGIAEKTVDNSAGAAGALTIIPRVGCFLMNNSAVAPDVIAATNIGQACYLVDDNTVALTSNQGARIPAGMIWAVDSSVSATYPQYPGGVWVLMVPGLSGGCASLTPGSVFAEQVVAADAAAGNATNETTFGVSSFQGVVSGVKYTANAAVTLNASNFATITVFARNGIGGAPVTVATLSTAATSLTAFVPQTFTLTAANQAIGAGWILSYSITKSGTGVQLPSALLTVF